MGALDLTQSAPTAPAEPTKRKKIRRSEENSLSDVLEAGHTRNETSRQKATGEGVQLTQRAREFPPAAGSDLALPQPADPLQSTLSLPAPDKVVVSKQVGETQAKSPPPSPLSTVKEVAIPKESHKEKDGNQPTTESPRTDPLPVQEKVAAPQQATEQPDRNQTFEATQPTRSEAGMKQQGFVINGTPTWLLQTLPETPQSPQETIISDKPSP